MEGRTGAYMYIAHALHLFGFKHKKGEPQNWGKGYKRCEIKRINLYADIHRDTTYAVTEFTEKLSRM